MSLGKTAHERTKNYRQFFARHIEGELLEEITTKKVEIYKTWAASGVEDGEVFLSFPRRTWEREDVF